MAQVGDKVAAFNVNCTAICGAMDFDSKLKHLVGQLLSEVPVTALFEALQHASDQQDLAQVDAICKCIDHVMQANGDCTSFFHAEVYNPRWIARFEKEEQRGMSTDAHVDKMLAFLVAGLQHTEVQAKRVTLNQIADHLHKQPTAEQVHALLDSPVPQELISLLLEEDTGISAQAADLLVQLAQQDKSLECYKSVLDLLVQTMQSDRVQDHSVESMRFLETIARICEKDEQFIEYAISSNAVELILNSLKSSDALYLLNVIDILPKLCNTKRGVTFLYEAGVLENLLRLTEDPFVGGNALRLIGDISSAAASVQVDSWNWSNQVLSQAFFSTIQDQLDSKDELKVLAAVDALASFASSTEKELRMLVENKMLCEKWVALAASNKMAIKVNCLHGISKVLSAATCINQKGNVAAKDATVWQLNHQLYTTFGHVCLTASSTLINASNPKANGMMYLMSCLRQPFEEIRIGVFHVMRAMAAQNHVWGLEQLQSYGGFYEFLLDRSTEPTKSSREWKFAVIDMLITSPFVDQIEPTMREKLETHVRQGPYLGRAPTEPELEAQ